MVRLQDLGDKLMLQLLMKPLLFILLLSSPVVFSSAYAQQAEGMIYIPEGEFIMGNNEGDDLKKTGGIVAIDEMPKRKVSLKAFYMDKYEVTKAQYKTFLDLLKDKGVKSFSHYKDEGIPMPYGWKDNDYHEGEDNSPVTAVDWYMANEYCKVLGRRLPAEEEWEKAARGTDGRTYPWGDDYKPDYANTIEYWAGRIKKLSDTKPLPVGSFKKDVSPYGVYDMAGNVMEWTSSLYRPYPGNNLKREIFSAEVYIIRGGCFHAAIDEFGRTTSRYFRRPTDSRFVHAELHTDITIGFRCAKDAE